MAAAPQRKPHYELPNASPEIGHCTFCQKGWLDFQACQGTECNFIRNATTTKEQDNGEA